MASIKKKKEIEENNILLNIMNSETLFSDTFSIFQSLMDDLGVNQGLRGEKRLLKI
jgi:hypothetical protein